MSEQGCNWDDLEIELAHWRRSGRTATLWWRDDDATIAGPALQRLRGLSTRWQVPMNLAVIPARADATLLRILSDSARARVLQHGYAHVDHGNGAEPAAELGGHRPAQIVLDELKDGHERLAGIVGEFLLPVLVPPWNRIAGTLVPHLVASGYRGLSCFYARQRRKESSGLSIANCHVDPVNWKNGAVFRGERKSLSMLITHLQGRRCGSVDADEATGVLTHHCNHDEQTWAFLERLFAQTHARHDVHWLDATQVFGS